MCRIKISGVEFDWPLLKQYRDAYISRLNKIYEHGLDTSHVERKLGVGKLVSRDPQTGLLTVDVNGEEITARHVVLATGSRPNALSFEGAEHMITSDGFFALNQRPRKVALIGAGYIGVELSGVLKGLGVDTSIFVRDKMLRNLDSDIIDVLQKSMKAYGASVRSPMSLLLDCPSLLHAVYRYRCS